VFEKEREIRGGLLNPTKVMAHCPPILRAAKLLGASIEQSGQLRKELPPLIYLRFASINGCPFELTSIRPCDGRRRRPQEGRGSPELAGQQLFSPAERAALEECRAHHLHRPAGRRRTC